mgnify:CR=1 FL=1
MKRTLLFLVIMVVGLSGLRAQSHIDEAKAKFIYNFTKFFDWPNNDQSSEFVIGVLSDNDVYYELSQFTRGKKVILQDITVKKFRKPEDVTNCHILYVAGQRTDDIPIVQKKTGENTLLISDNSKGIEKGAALNFLLIGNRLKFEFAASNAQNQGLKFSSRLRDMATRNH